ncbi:MAG TPA: histidine kinase dimerization/phospho-acceptor domain-containing protein, partial [Candidatus Polarisedimenticolaceae bacterium]|nr:histidine kinase dimerization/phospho-acceptor domain-containing protein [Candidatus Polarisedimenticolaceae bacterium]
MTSTVRHLLTMLLATAATIALVVAAGTALLRGSELDAAVARLQAETDLVARWVERIDPRTDCQDVATEIGRRLGVRVTLIAEEGTVLGDSSRTHASLARLDNHLERPEIRGARRGAQGFSRRVSQTTNVEYVYTARTVSSPSPVYYVRLGLPAGELGPATRGNTWWWVVLALGATIPLGLVGYLSLRRLTRPVGQLADAVERTAGSELREPLPIPDHGSDEVIRLGTNINRLKLTLLRTLDALDSERSTLSSVVAGMREGLLLVGADRRIRLANAALKRILDLDLEPEGRLLEAVVRHPSVVADIDSALSEREETQESVIKIPGSDRVFELHVTPLEAARSGEHHDVLALFVDITRLDRLEKVRREFVANVSHELRTPLTSIKAFVENLIDGGLEDGDNARKFLEIVRRHADHMGELIEDLTDLSLIETGSIMLELRRVDAAEVAREVVAKCRPLAEARDVEVRIDLPSPLFVTSDRRRLEQMLTNLVHNALKFNREGGQVVIGGESSLGATTLFVEDTGIGIPSNHLDKVFERFFQVNRDRSRAVGGTGLGLSIVKH